MPHTISHHLAHAQQIITDRLQDEHTTGNERRIYQAALHAVMTAIALIRRIHHHKRLGFHLPPDDPIPAPSLAPKGDPEP